MLCVVSGRGLARKVWLLLAWPPTSPTAVDHWPRSKFFTRDLTPINVIFALGESSMIPTLLYRPICICFCFCASVHGFTLHPQLTPLNSRQSCLSFAIYSL